MKDIKAVFFDLDGTLYTHNVHKIIESSVDALKKLKENGYKVAIATSRCKSETEYISRWFNEFPFDGYVFDGGAFTMADGEVVAKYTVADEVVKRLAKLQEKYEFDLRYSTPKGNFTQKELSIKYRDVFFYLYLTTPEIKKFEDGDEALNVLIQGDKEILDMMEEKYLHDVNYLYESDSVIEITAPDIGKHKGLEALSKYWDIPMSQFMAFGDGGNDITMFQEAGAGIVMGNAKEHVKQYGDEVCLPQSEDGIYRYLKNQHMI